MDIIIRVGKWLAPATCIVLGLLILNGAAGSWWVSWGPPTNYPEAWEQRAVSQIGYAIALFATAPMLFNAFKYKFNLKKYRYKYWWLLTIIIAIGYPHVRVFMLTDSCLDSGGKWQATYIRCQYD